MRASADPVPAGELVLSLADLQANHGDYGEALVRLELCAEQAPLPGGVQEEANAPDPDVRPGFLHLARGRFGCGVAS